MLDQVYVKGKSGYIILTSIGDKAVLTILARPKAKLGLVFLEASRAVDDLEKFI